MSAVAEQPARTRRAHTYLSPAKKGAIIAAIANGMPQTEASKQFGVHRNTISKLYNDVRRVDHPANPLAKEWKDTFRTAAQSAALDLMNQRNDVVSAGNAGIKVLFGLGDLSNSSKVELDADVRLQVAWMPVQGAEYASGVQVVEPPIDTPSRMITDGDDTTTTCSE